MTPSPRSRLALAVLGTLSTLGSSGCALHRRPPIIEPAVLVGCGALPPPPALCIETLSTDASSSDVIRCYAADLADLIVDDRSLRAQYGPCSKEPATVPGK